MQRRVGVLRALLLAFQGRLFKAIPSDTNIYFGCDILSNSPTRDTVEMRDPIHYLPTSVSERTATCD